MGGRRKGKDPNHGNSTMVKMRRFMVQVRTSILSTSASDLIERSFIGFFRPPKSRTKPNRPTGVSLNIIDVAEHNIVF